MMKPARPTCHGQYGFWVGNGDGAAILEGHQEVFGAEGTPHMLTSTAGAACVASLEHGLKSLTS